jgi:hypothetical protein
LEGEIEPSTKREVGQRGREVIYSLNEVISQREAKEGRWEVFNSLIESTLRAKEKMSEGERERREFLVERETEI